eukprot:SAG11_NODE_506_length_8881_cov_10.836825_3_plen_102_part_00
MLFVGGTRQLVPAYCGIPAVGIDLRPEAVQECRGLAKALKLEDRCHFLEGDIRETDTVVNLAIRANAKVRPPGGFGGLFTSIPFWKLESCKCVVTTYFFST